MTTTTVRPHLHVPRAEKQSIYLHILSGRHLYVLPSTHNGPARPFCSSHTLEHFFIIAAYASQINCSEYDSWSVAIISTSFRGQRERESDALLDDEIIGYEFEIYKIYLYAMRIILFVNFGFSFMLAHHARPIQCETFPKMNGRIMPRERARNVIELDTQKKCK